MYYLMNKDKEVAAFEAKPRTEFSENTVFEQLEVKGKLPIGYKDINAWISGRKASKHSAHLQAIMKQLGCYDNEGFIRITHAASINDTFWVKSANESTSWNQVSLYWNQFTEVISKLAFEGVGLYETVLSSTSPELTCDGSFRKCFRKEAATGQYKSDIFLYKRGNEIGTGLEPYCEQMASEIAEHISPDNAVCYELVTLHDKLASKCNLFTNEQYGYAAFAKAADIQKLNLQDIFDFYAELGSEQAFREMLVIDSLCFNQDRHAGNYGVLFDTDSLQIQRMSPVFDLNISLLPYVMNDEFEQIGDRLFEYAPKLGEDFTRIGQMGMNDVLRERVKDMEDFSFSFRGDDTFSPQRVTQLENIVRRQAQAILSKEKLYTKDVFFSQKAQNIQQEKDESHAAEALMDNFLERADAVALGTDTFSSVCASTNAVQYYLENASYMMTIDFLKQLITITNNAMQLSPDELKKENKAFWNDCKAIQKVLKQYMHEKGGKKFTGYFKSGSSLDSDSMLNR